MQLRGLLEQRLGLTVFSLLIIDRGKVVDALRAPRIGQFKILGQLQAGCQGTLCLLSAGVKGGDSGIAFSIPVGIFGSQTNWRDQNGRKSNQLKSHHPPRRV
jgi:hypothetical protein